MSERDYSEPTPAPDDAPPERLEPSEEDDDGLNWRLVIGAVVSAAVIGGLVVDGLESETYFFTVDEAVAKAESVQNRQIRVKGKVVGGSIEGKDGEVGRAFDISEKGKQIRIEYDQALPDTFEEDVRVVATGKLHGKTLKASEIMVKCPSRYEGSPPTAGEGKKPPQAKR
ncbi:MAG: cytochrome c maturation protein CcmE [Bradymonadaceae bacterium]